MVEKAQNVAVKFVGDDDVVENITLVKDNKRTGKKKRDIIYDHSKLDKAELSSSDDEDNTYQAPTALCPLKSEIDGQELFQLSRKTPKKTPGKKLSNKDSSASKKANSKTPKSSSKTAPTNGNAHSLRQKPQRNGLQDAVFDSDPELSDSENSENTDSDDSLLSSGSGDKNLKHFAEDYFTVQNKTKSGTSNRTLSKVNLPKSNIQDLQKILQNTAEFHQKSKEQLYKKCKSSFQKWLFQLHEGFNILLYGIGSKYHLLQKFQDEYLSKYLCVEINGFYPSLTIKQVLNTITEDVIEHEGNFASPFDQVEFIKQHFHTAKEDLYIIIHNMDGVPFRGVKCQSILSSLASSSRIHFIASVDHINSSLIWDQINLSQFHWIWYSIATYEPYILETSYQSTLLREQSNQLMLSSLLHVYQSLTPNNQGVFLIIAKHQMDKKDTGNYLGITFNEWYQACREAFKVSSELTMSAQMSEFKNHKLLSSRKSFEGIEHWYIPIDSNTLEQFLERDDI